MPLRELIHSKYFSVNRAANPLTEKTWGRDWYVQGIVTTKWRNISLVSRGSEEVGELLATNIARTARSQLDGRHLLLREYLQTWTTLIYLLNMPINNPVIEDELPAGNNPKTKVLARILGECAVRLCKFWPYFRPKSVIFHTCFQTWPISRSL